MAIKSSKANIYLPLGEYDYIIMIMIFDNSGWEVDFDFYNFILLSNEISPTRPALEFSEGNNQLWGFCLVYVIDSETIRL